MLTKKDFDLFSISLSINSLPPALFPGQAVNDIAVLFSYSLILLC